MSKLRIADKIHALKGRDLPPLGAFKSILEILPVSVRGDLFYSYWLLGGPGMEGWAQDFWLGLLEKAIVRAHLGTRRRPGRPRKGGRR